MSKNICTRISRIPDLPIVFVVSSLLNGVCFFSVMVSSAQAADVSPAALKSSRQDTSIKIVKKPLSSIFRHKNYKFEGEFPQFVGSPKKTIAFLNKEVKDDILSGIPGEGDGMGWNEEPVQSGKDLNSHWCGYELKLLTNDFVSFTLTTSFCCSGAPHPVSKVHSFNYRLTPQCKPIVLGDMLGKKANYKLVSKMLKQTLKADGEAADTPADFSVDKNDTFFVFDKKGIGWRWGDYAMGSYVHGAKAGYLSYKQLEKIAMPGSIAASFLH